MNAKDDLTTLHIPVEAALSRRFAVKAKRLGFPSAQAYIRVWMTAVAEGRTLDFGDDWGEPTSEAAARLNRLAAEAIVQSNAGELPSFTNVRDMMEYLGGDKAD
jgi:hypothetical protein